MHQMYIFIWINVVTLYMDLIIYIYIGTQQQNNGFFKNVKLHEICFEVFY